MKGVSSPPFFLNKMAAPDHVQTLFRRIRDHGRDGEYNKAIEAASEVLKYDADDQDARQAKAACLVHVGKCSDALKEVNRLLKTRPPGGEGLPLMKGYCLYRLGRYKECLAVLKPLEDSPDGCGAGVHELLAQTYYRLERYRESCEAYERAFQQQSTAGGEDEFAEERRTNLLAARALAAQEGTPLSPLGVGEEKGAETYEQAFNASLIAIANGNLTEASRLLEQAEQMAREQFEEDGYDEDEMEAELGILQLQCGYLKQLLGQQEAANQMYLSCIKSNPDDVTQVAIASNNILVLNRDRDVFDSKKRVKALSNDTALSKLTGTQRDVVHFNLTLFALTLGQTAQAREMMGRLQQGAGQGGGLAALAEVALLCCQGQHSQGAEFLIRLVEEHPTAASPLVYLTLAQLQLTHQHSPQSAAQTLAAFPKMFDHLGVLAYLVSLHTRKEGGGVDEACALWTRAISHWAGQPGGRDTLKAILMQAATFGIENGRPQDAVSHLEQLRKLDPSDPRILVKLVSAYSQFSPSQAEEVSVKLPLPEQAANMDADALEQMPIYRHRVAKATVTEQKGADVVAMDTSKKKKRKRKPRLPKNYDPNVKPDPERWLPLRERSHYRRGKKKAAQTLRGTQGAASALVDRLDASRQPSEEKKGADKQTSAVQPAAAAKPKVPAAKKKGKKKGKGW